MPRDDHVRMLGHDRQRPEGVIAGLLCFRETLDDRSCLDAREMDWGIAQRRSRLLALDELVRTEFAERSPFLRLRRWSEPGKLSRADEIGPRSSRVIRQPEAIGRQDQVVAVDHGNPPKSEGYRANPRESISASPAARR